MITQRLKKKTQKDIKKNVKERLKKEMFFSLLCKTKKKK